MKVKRSEIDTEVTADRERFRASALLLVQLIRAAGYSSRISRDDSLPQFSKLSASDRAAALARVETMIAVCRATMNAGRSINDSTAMLESYLEYSGTTTAPGVLENLQDDDNVEVYNTSHHLMFANIKIFTVTSFSVEELYCQAWTDLLTRDIHGLHEQLFSAATDILSGKRTTLLSTAYIPDHVCREVGSPEQRSFIIFPNFFAPLFSGNKTVGLVCSNKLFAHREERFED